jgi:hypothetical protein
MVLLVVFYIRTFHRIMTAETVLIESLTSKRGQPCSRRHCNSGNLLSLSTSSHFASNVLFKLRNFSFLKQLWGESIPGGLLHSHSLSVRPPGDVSDSEAFLFSKLYIYSVIRKMAGISDQNYQMYHFSELLGFCISSIVRYSRN